MEIIGTLHPLCKPQQLGLLGAQQATGQIIRAGGSTGPQHWGVKGEVSSGRAVMEFGGNRTEREKKNMES